MGAQVMATQTARIGKWKGELLSRVMPREVLHLTATQKSIPKNVSDTVIYRRWVPYDATIANPNILVQDVNPANTVETEASNRVNTALTANTLAEGVTPTPDSLVAQDITVVLIQYGCLYSFSDKVADLYEDDISEAMKTQVAERIALIRELELYSKMRACTNRFYGGAGTTIATVDGKITAKLLRKIARSMSLNTSKKITSILAPTPNIGTKPVEAAYIVYCHTDVEADLRDTTAFPSYTPVAQYGSRKPICDDELGSFEQFRFVASPELVAFQNGGVAVGATACYSTGGVKIDVYPLICVGQEAYGTVALRGAKSFSLHIVPVGNEDSADPLAQRGYIGSKFYATSVVLNQQWMATAFVGVGNLA